VKNAGKHFVTREGRKWNTFPASVDWHRTGSRDGHFTRDICPQVGEMFKHEVDCVRAGVLNYGRGCDRVMVGDLDVSSLFYTKCI
jgi:hypothetical protein